MNNKTLNSLKVTTGIALMSSALGVSLPAQAGNPFAVTDIGSGYQLASKDSEGKCGEGKCGGEKGSGESKGDKEGKCGEGKCGGEKGAAKDGEGKCGEGKCGSAG